VYVAHDVSDWVRLPPSLPLSCVIYFKRRELCHERNAGFRTTVGNPSALPFPPREGGLFVASAKYIPQCSTRPTPPPPPQVHAASGGPPVDVDLAFLLRLARGVRGASSDDAGWAEGEGDPSEPISPEGGGGASGDAKWTGWGRPDASRRIRFAGGVVPVARLCAAVSDEAWAQACGGDAPERSPPPPPPPSRTKWTRLVPLPVLSGHVSPAPLVHAARAAPRALWPAALRVGPLGRSRAARVVCRV